MSIPTTTVELSAATADQMKAIGRALGRAMGVGDVVGLVGPLGAGKTTLAQGLAEGLDVPRHRHVASPTFALVNEHAARVPFVHADFYRLRNQAELAELGLDEIFDRAAVVIEWVDLFPRAIPSDHVLITITPLPHGARTVSLHATGPNADRLTQSVVGQTG